MKKDRINRPAIVESDIKLSEGKVSVKKGKFVLQFKTMGREEYDFHFFWDGLKLFVQTGVNRLQFRAGPPNNFCIERISFSSGEAYRFENIAELKHITSIIALCLEYYPQSLNYPEIWYQKKPDISVSLNQRNNLILSNEYPSERISWSAVL